MFTTQRLRLKHRKRDEFTFFAYYLVFLFLFVRMACAPLKISTLWWVKVLDCVILSWVPLKRCIWMPQVILEFSEISPESLNGARKSWKFCFFQDFIRAIFQTRKKWIIFTLMKSLLIQNFSNSFYHFSIVHLKCTWHENSPCFLLLYLEEHLKYGKMAFTCLSDLIPFLSY